MLTPKQKIEQEESLATAYHDNEKRMNSHAFFKTHDSATSQDLVQDTFLRAWLYLVKGGKVNLMKPFLYHILNQLIIDEYRKHKTTSLDVLLEKGFEPSIDYTKDTSNILDGKALIFLIKYLPLKYEKIIRMRFIQDLSLEEISLITGQTRNAIAVQIHRGLEKLKKICTQRKLFTTKNT